MPYHVRITRKSRKGFEGDDLKLDLTKEQLSQRFIDPYHNGNPIVVGGRTIPLNDILKIRINYTDEPSTQLLPIIRMERSREQLTSLLSDEWYVTTKGRDMTDDLITVPPGTSVSSKTHMAITKKADGKTVFVIHGRNLKARDEVFTFLHSLGLHPLEWIEAVKETEKSAPYIGEVLDKAFELAQAIIVLMTPDDEGRLKESLRHSDDKEHETHLTGQARLNVIFEAGMAMGRNPNRTIIVELGTLRPFSDIAGRHTIRLNNTPEKRQELATRLETAGCQVNTKGTRWFKAGEFDEAII